ncbi:hypothetical protein BJH93_03575 [Kocuria polaris]|nr:hypothetical protein [Kocuria polaris]
MTEELETQAPADPLRHLGQVRRGNVFEETMEQLLRGMRLGVLAPGRKLPAERELAESLGVSRATLREALAELQAAGFITIQRGRYGGAFVAAELPAETAELRSEDQGRVEDVLVYRAIVEPAAAEIAARSALTAAQRAELNSALAALRAAEPAHYRPLDARFHVTIAELSGSSMLAASVAEARAATSQLLDRIPFLETNIAHSDEQHARIATAILTGDAAQARTLMLEHLEGTAALLRGFLADGSAS